MDREPVKEKGIFAEQNSSYGQGVSEMKKV
jgi:hypothetical protein